MKKIIKRIGVGMLGVILLPLFVAGLALAAVYAILLWLGMLVWVAIRYFAGKKVLGPTESDVRAAQILKKRQQREIDEMENPTAPQSQQPQQSLTIEKAVFINTGQGQIPQNVFDALPNQQPDAPQQIAGQPVQIAANQPSGYIEETTPPAIEQKEDTTEAVEEKPVETKKKKWWQK